MTTITRIAMLTLILAASGASASDYLEPPGTDTACGRDPICSSGYQGSTPLLWMPPNRYIHRPPCHVMVKYIDYEGGAISYSERATCTVYLVALGRGGMGPALQRCAWINEIARLNGAQDFGQPGVNLSWTDQMEWNRTCFERDWSAAWRATGGKVCQSGNVCMGQ